MANEMKKKVSVSHILTAVCMVVLGSIAVSAQEIRYNFMPGTDFTKYKTYKWARVPKAQYPNQILDTQIMQAIDSQLSLKGLTKSSGDDADLVVTYQAAVEQEKQWNSYSTDTGGWGYGRWGGWGGGGMSTTTTTSETIHIGTLDVDIYDAAAKNQIWKGQATKTLGSGKNPEKVNKNINKAVEKLFKKYPPPAKK